MDDFPDPFEKKVDPDNIDFKHELLELLCVIHRDGGHYIAEHGLAKAIEDAHKVIYQLRARLGPSPIVSKADETLRVHYEKVRMK